MDIFEKLEDYQVNEVKQIMRNSVDAKPRKTVFFGDSLIHGYDLKYYFPEKEIYNCGVDGATTDLLLHLQPYAIRDYNPEKVVLLIGTNDLSDRWQFDKLEIAFNVFKLVEIMRNNNPGLDIVVISPLPIDESRKNTKCRNNMQLRILGNEIRDALQSFIGLTYVDVFDAFIENGMLNESFTEDGLHLNEKGYDKLTSLIRKYI